MQIFRCALLISVFLAVGCQSDITVDATFEGSLSAPYLQLCEEITRSGMGVSVTPGQCIYNGYAEDPESCFFSASPSSETTDFRLFVMWDDNGNGMCDDGELHTIVELLREDGPDFTVDVPVPSEAVDCPLSL